VPRNACARGPNLGPRGVCIIFAVDVGVPSAAWKFSICRVWMCEGRFQGFVVPALLVGVSGCTALPVHTGTWPSYVQLQNLSSTTERPTCS
jgi:hypothetical protein